jgi:hypothetical protein
LQSIYCTYTTWLLTFVLIFFCFVTRYTIGGRTCSKGTLRVEAIWLTNLTILQILRILCVAMLHFSQKRSVGS